MTERDNTLMAWFISLTLLTISFLIIKARYDAYVASEAHTCVCAYRKAGFAHIKFKSVNHHYNWCDAHESDWYGLSNYRVQQEGDKIRAEKGYIPAQARK